MEVKLEKCQLQNKILNFSNLYTTIDLLWNGILYFLREKVPTTIAPLYFQSIKKVLGLDLQVSNKRILLSTGLMHPRSIMIY